MSFMKAGGTRYVRMGKPAREAKPTSVPPQTFTCPACQTALVADKGRTRICPCPNRVTVRDGVCIAWVASPPK